MVTNIQEGNNTSDHYHECELSTYPGEQGGTALIAAAYQNNLSVTDLLIREWIILWACRTVSPRSPLRTRRKPFRNLCALAQSVFSPGTARQGRCVVSRCLAHSFSHSPTLVDSGLNSFMGYNDHNWKGRCARYCQVHAKGLISRQ
jgi:hypothetical protein